MAVQTSDGQKAARIQRISYKVKTLRLLVGAVSLATLSLAALQARAADDAPSAAEANAKLSNPNNSLASLVFRNQYRWYDGELPDADNQDNYTLLFQPIFPFVLGKDEDDVEHKLFLRPAIPLQMDQPFPESKNGNLEFDDASGLGDIGFDIAYGLSYPNGFQLAGGMVGSLPTATGDVPGGDDWLAGPEIFTGVAGRMGFLGALATHAWDISSWSDNDVSLTSVQPLVVWIPEKARTWGFGSVPIITYDWKSNDIAVPINAFAQKTLNIRGTPTRVQLEVNYFPNGNNAFRPEWFVGLNITPVVRNFLQPGGGK